jgi:hypothetical protein
VTKKSSRPPSTVIGYLRVSTADQNIEKNKADILHRYWSVVENRRCGRGKVVQRQLLYHGEINDSQHESWCRTIEVFDDQAERTMPLAYFRLIGSYPTLSPALACRSGSTR